MIRNLFTVALRNLARYRFFSAINLVGLSLGFAACLAIWMYVSHELSYDQFHTNADRIYRINQTFIWGDTDALFGSTGPAVRQAITDEVPEFEALTRVHTPGNSLVSVVNPLDELIVYEESEILAVDDNFLDIFTFPMIQGNPNTALVKPQSIVLTEQAARKYFGETNVLGRELMLGEEAKRQSYQVTGVVRDIPTVSHIQFDFLVSMTSYPRVKQANDSWMWTTFVTFGLMRPDADPELVAQKVAQVPGKYLEAFLQKYRGISYQEFLESGETWDLYIQPLLDIHLRSTNVYSRLNQISDIRIIYILIFVGTFILALSLINYVNLATAKATTRAKEVGIRKVIGSRRSQLIGQFLLESILYVLIAFMISILLIEVSLPAINNVTEIQLSFSSVMTWQSWAAFGAVILLISLGSSIYPAMILSSFQPAKVLKSTSRYQLGGNGLRNVLVAAQFSISIMMIATALIISDQVSYWKRLDLGFDRDNQLVIRNAQRLSGSMDAFAEELRNYAQVERVSISSDTPPMIFDFDNFTMQGVEDVNLAVNYLTSDEYFLDTYNLQLTHGRNFARSFNDSLNVIVNKQLTRSFGFSNPEEAMKHDLVYNGRHFKIVGIIDDFETSFNNQTYPMAILDHRAPIFRNPSTHITARLNKETAGDELVAIVAAVNQLWLDQGSNAPFDYTFADQEFMELFQDNIRFGKLIGTLSILSTVIACMGLIGLVAFVLEKRKKEIGIRKVLGASVQQIWLLLSTSFGMLMLIGLIVGGTISWLLMQQWMMDFEIKKDLTAWPILLAGGIMFVIALAAVSFQLLNAARTNPVNYLHEE